MKFDLSTRQWILLFIGLGSFLIWSGMAYFDNSLRGDYVKYIISVVVGVTGLVLRDMPSSSNSSPPPPSTAIIKENENENENAKLG